MSLTGIILAGGRSSRFGFNKLRIKIEGVPLLIDQIFKLSFFCDEIIISTSGKYYPIISNELNKIVKYKKRYDFKKIQASGPETDFKNFPERTAAPPDIKIVPDENSYKDFGINNSSNISSEEKIKSDYMEAGSIIGIYSGLTCAASFYSLIIACDMPFISYNLLKSLTCETGADTGTDTEGTGTDKSAVIPDCYRKKDGYIIRSSKGFEVLCGLYSRNCIDILKESIKKQRYKISDTFTYLDIEIISGKKLRSAKIDNLNFFNINQMQDYHQFKDIWQNNKLAIGGGASFTEVWNSFFFR